MKDTSRNLMPVDLLMWGEGLHNNHHKFSGRANFGVKKFEFDPLYPIIRFLAWAKVLELRKTPE
jgi:stearoyl-CoA desaturase (delta-9 desaturase)